MSTKKKIYLSPSNQNANVYSYGNTNECVQCNKIAAYAKKALERCGFEVKKAPEGQMMTTSIAESNKWGADLHLPIHTNAYNGKHTGGTLVMLYSNTAENNKAGKAILDAIAPISPGSDYSLRYNPGLAELNSTDALAVYIEVEFHDTKEGAKWIVDNVEKIGEAIAKGVCEYYGLKYVTKPAATPKEEELRKGNSGLNVLCLKYLIQIADDMGILDYNMTLGNNKFSTGTEAAIKTLQKKMNLKQTGVANEELVNKLYRLIVEYYPVEGDFNEDGNVNIKDATAIQKHLAGVE